MTVTKVPVITSADPKDRREQEYPLELIDIGYRGMPRKARERLRRAERLRERRRIRRAVIRKKLIKGSAASVLGLSITLAGLFPSSADLLKQQAIRQMEDPHPVEMMLEEEIPGGQEDERRKAKAGSGSLFARLRVAARVLVLKIPPVIRACVGVPLWAAGYLAIHLATGVYQTILSPVLSHVIGYILCAAVMLCVFVLTMKCIFPHIPLKKILRWRNIRRILIGAAVLKLLDVVLPLFWDGYARYRYLLMVLGGCAVLGILLAAGCRRYRTR